jgi:hypothetical protein
MGEGPDGRVVQAVVDAILETGSLLLAERR